jgi:hypothetical protein
MKNTYHHNSFLKQAVESLFTYKTPKKIIEYIDKEKCTCIIGNPPIK